MFDPDAIREQLEKELEEVLSQSERLQAHLRNQDRSVPADWDDRAQFLENDEVLEALEDRSRTRIEEILQTLDRIRAGMWQVCSRCGSDIEDGRLEILPTTSVCSACADGD